MLDWIFMKWLQTKNNTWFRICFGHLMVSVVWLSSRSILNNVRLIILENELSFPSYSLLVIISYKCMCMSVLISAWTAGWISICSIIYRNVQNEMDKQPIIWDTLTLMIKYSPFSTYQKKKKSIPLFLFLSLDTT